MSDEQPAPSAWRPLVDEWVTREQQMRPHLPVLADHVRVRDAVEVGDQAYVLVSYDVQRPWPAEEDVSAPSGPGGTAVIQAERVRQPWIERDASRARTTWSSVDGAGVHVHEHVLGRRRAYSGVVEGSADAVELGFDGDWSTTATVVDGWFLSVVDDDRRIRTCRIGSADPIELERIDVPSMLAEPSFARAGADPMYFSPLDLRSVRSIVRWARRGDIVAVASSLEQYDEGGMLRVRIDGIRADDDTFVTWPVVVLTVDGEELPSAVCGEYSLADTISLDIGFRPWLPAGADRLDVRVEGIRGADGMIGPLELEVPLGAPS